jgi:hypothetical protein
METPISNEEQNAAPTEPASNQAAEDTGNEEHKAVPAGVQKRIDQITYRYRDLERKFNALQEEKAGDSKAFEMLKNQYNELAEVLDGVDQKVSKSNAPNYEDDPVAYMNWRDEQLLKNVGKLLNKDPATPKTPPSNGSSQQIDPREAVLATLHDDYYEVLNSIESDMEADSVLRNEILGSKNPFKAAYTYGKKKQERDGMTRQQIANQAYGESGGVGPPDNGKMKLTADEKFMAKMLNVAEEKYLKRKEKIAQRRGNR